MPLHFKPQPDSLAIAGGGGGAGGAAGSAPGGAGGAGGAGVFRLQLQPHHAIYESSLVVGERAVPRVKLYAAKSEWLYSGSSVVMI